MGVFITFFCHLTHLYKCLAFFVGGAQATDNLSLVNYGLINNNTRQDVAFVWWFGKLFFFSDNKTPWSFKSDMVHKIKLHEKCFGHLWSYSMSPIKSLLCPGFWNALVSDMHALPYLVMFSCGLIYKHNLLGAWSCVDCVVKVWVLCSEGSSIIRLIINVFWW